MSAFFPLLNGYAFVVVRRGAREKGKGRIIKHLPTLGACQKMAKELSDKDNENFYWAMPITEF